MIYTAIDTFYLSDEQLKDSPSRKDGIDESSETTLRIYGCDIIQESGILLKLPQAVMATGQVLLHRFYCKKSFARFNVKRVAASCVWLASKLEESPKKARHVVLVFHRMECRRENQPAEHLDISSKRYAELKIDLNRTERHLLKEMGFICHVEHPHKFISNYLVTLRAPHELRLIAWNLANDSLRTTLCVRFKSEVVACGVVYAAARRFEVPLPENPPWWKVFDADKAGIDEVCRVLAQLYSLPKAQYISVCKDGDSFTSSYKIKDSPAQQVLKEGLLNSQVAGKETGMNNEAATADSVGAKDSLLKLPLGKTDGDTRSKPIEGETREDSGLKFNTDSQTGGRNKEDRDWERPKSRERDRGRDSDKERDGDKLKERSRHSKDRRKDSGHSDKSRHYSSRDRSEYRTSSHSSRDKDRHRHQS